jgi:Ion channel
MGGVVSKIVDEYWRVKTGPMIGALMLVSMELFFEVELLLRKISVEELRVTMLMKIVYIPLLMSLVFWGLSRQVGQSEFAYRAHRVTFVLLLVGLIVAAIFGYANIYRLLGLVDVDKVTTDPFTCLYFSIVTWTTLGYGDVRPSDSARLVAASEAMVGYLAMAAFIAMFGNFMNKLREIRVAKEEEWT